MSCPDAITVASSVLVVLPWIPCAGATKTAGFSKEGAHSSALS